MSGGDVSPGPGTAEIVTILKESHRVSGARRRSRDFKAVRALHTTATPDGRRGRREDRVIGFTNDTGAVPLILV